MVRASGFNSHHRYATRQAESGHLRQALASVLFAYSPVIRRHSIGFPTQRRVAPLRVAASVAPNTKDGHTRDMHSNAIDALQAADAASNPIYGSVSFSHVHAYVDSLKPLEEYKRLEQKLNAFTKTIPNGIEADRKRWLELSKTHGDPITGVKDPAAWKGSKQDVVEQLLVGLGWRITGKHVGANTRSFVVSSPAMDGAKFIFTAHNEKTLDGEPVVPVDSGTSSSASISEPDHFSSKHLQRFAEHRAGREGFTVLAFDVAPGGVDLIQKRYAEKHPKLLLDDAPHEYDGYKVLDVFAYYKGETRESDEDRGTLIRFVEGRQSSAAIHGLPGIETIEAVFDDRSLPVYCDHWVSNVVSRTGFIDVLEDTLGFTSKVDFNAGVVAAGEAQIESTVAGNDPEVEVDDEDMALTHQAQVYLPINNALSQVGHVHQYLDEIGQGIQHVASRVSDLPAMIQRANDMREITGAGLSFLNIPQSYYGSLRKEKMVQDLELDAALVDQYVRALQEAGVVSLSDIVDVDTSRERVAACLPANVSAEIIEYIMRARYSNLYDLLRDSVDESTYLAIVRNQILVDVQGGDLLMQIFSAPVLQREPGQEAPFFEFIQRVCSTKKNPSTGKRLPIKPGCGGFGIRNFLTLFLSIEVSKATKQRTDAVLAGRHDVAAYYSQMVDAFTRQLEESNPVLTFISDVMTEEGEALQRGDEDVARRCKADKEKGQQTLMAISMKYKNLMQELRESAPGS